MKKYLLSTLSDGGCIIFNCFQPAVSLCKKQFEIRFMYDSNRFWHFWYLSLQMRVFLHRQTTQLTNCLNCIRFIFLFTATSNLQVI